MTYTCTMSRSRMTYADYRAMYLAHCLMYRRLFRKTLELSFLRELTATQRKLAALRYDA